MGRYLARWYRPVAAGLTILLGVTAVAVATRVYGAFAARDLVAIDYRMFMQFGHRWATAGTLYLPYQLAGPYPYDVAAGTTNVAAMPSLYPPLMGPVLWIVSFLPAILWWAIPLGIIGYSLRRAPPWTWPIVAAAACLPQVPALLVVGGSSMWILAGVAAGVRFGWPVLIVVLKPTLAPFALVGVRHRSTWVGALVLGAVSILLLPEWLRYIAVLVNLQSPGLLYSLGDAPLFGAVLVASWRWR